jgi:glyoxylase-like metal-dependent hydrolase (beta-lactamase superfamily II)
MATMTASGDTPNLSTSEQPVAEFWFALRPIANDIVWLREIHVDPYAVGDIWLVRGSETDLVIDTGSGIVPLAPVIDAISDRPVLAVALNHFYDHAGGWWGFGDRACHPLDAAALRDPTEETSLVSQYLTDKSLTALPRDGYSTSEYRMVGAAPTRLVQDGERIDLGSRSLEVLHTPGRGPGGIALWEAETGSLFTSDMLYDGPHGPAWPPENSDLYARSLRRFRDLPVTVVHPGHYGWFERARMLALIDEQLAALSRC